MTEYTMLTSAYKCDNNVGCTLFSFQEKKRLQLRLYISYFTVFGKFLALYAFNTPCTRCFSSKDNYQTMALDRRTERTLPVPGIKIPKKRIIQLFLQNYPS